MTTCFTLPNGYTETDYVNLYANRRIYRNLNIASFLIGAAVIAAGWLWRGIDALLALLGGGMGDYFLWLLLLAVSALAYLALHELTHGLCMRLFSGIRPHYGRKGVLLYTGSEAYLCRRDYIITALAPVLIFGVLFGLLSVFLRDEWFWLVVALQVVNLGGAVGDFYMTYRALRQPKSALFRDSGVAVTIYTEKNDEANTESGM